jgi:hypothetical protein
MSLRDSEVAGKKYGCESARKAAFSEKKSCH